MLHANARKLQLLQPGAITLQTVAAVTAATAATVAAATAAAATAAAAAAAANGTREFSWIHDEAGGKCPRVSTPAVHAVGKGWDGGMNYIASDD